jgi:ABC-type branched-subunit amino acid transport system ATPase component
MAEILRADHVSKAFGDNRILGDIDIHLQDGELVCVLGVSGVGKTTLFNVLSGLIRPDSGRLELRDDSGAFEDVTGQAGSGCRRWAGRRTDDDFCEVFFVRGLHFSVKHGIMFSDGLCS